MSATRIDDCLTIDETVSLSWQVLSEPPNQQVYDRQNSQTLTLLSVLDEPPLPEMEEAEACHIEFSHIHMKLNVLMSLVSELLMQDNDQLEPHTLKISEQSIAWQSTHQPVEGSLSVVTVLLEGCPRPLRLLGVIQPSVLLQGRSWVVLKLQGNEHFFDMLGKFVFRRHRRAVAIARGEVLETAKF